MNVKNYVRALLCLYLTLPVYPLAAQALKVGDPLPAKLWNLPLQVVNHPEGKETVTLSEYKNKLIILDFWATWCKPCIKSLGKLDSLQKEFGEQLAVIPVTRETPDKCLPMIKKRNWALPSVVTDTALGKNFPHRSLPHQVWIKAGKVLALTGPISTTRENLTKVLSNQPPQVIMKETEPVRFNINQPLLIDGNGGGAENLLHQSIITRPITGANGIIISQNKFMITNASIHELFREAYSDTISWTARNNRVMSTLNDSLNEKIFKPAYTFKRDYDSQLLNETWKTNNTYCYSLTLPEEVSRAQKLKIAKGDLNRFFGQYMGINARIENRNVKCLVIIRRKDSPVSTPPEGVESKYLNDGKNTYFSYVNYPFRAFFDGFAERNKYSALPLVNETDYAGNITMEFKGPLTDLEMVREELLKNGFDLIEKEVNVNMLVFYSLNNKNL